VSVRKSTRETCLKKARDSVIKMTIIAMVVATEENARNNNNSITRSRSVLTLGIGAPLLRVAGFSLITASDD